ncbi:MAG: hypothetical protein IT451_11915 [Candidatus Brocadia sp.]|nr:hypothetical protein [Candidatus Brocadia sp.]
MMIKIEGKEIDVKILGEKIIGFECKKGWIFVQKTTSDGLSGIFSIPIQRLQKK